MSTRIQLPVTVGAVSMKALASGGDFESAPLAFSIVVP